MLRNFLLLTICLTVAACNSGKNPAAPSAVPVAGPPPVAPPVPAPPATPTITISSAGMSPLDLSIVVGQRVAFVNNDSRPHDVVGGKDPANPDCPEILQAGFMSPGQRGETAVFTTARTCEYHDHTQMGVPAFQGRIVIR